MSKPMNFLYGQQKVRVGDFLDLQDAQKFIGELRGAEKCEGFDHHFFTLDEQIITIVPALDGVPVITPEQFKKRLGTGEFAWRTQAA